MNNEVLDFYSRSSIDDPSHPLYEVIFIDEERKDLSALQDIAPALSKGWFELANLDLEEKKELMRKFWQMHFPFFSVDDFFDRVDDLGIFLTKSRPDAFFQPELVYSLEKEGGFFRAFPPLNEEQISRFSIEFDFILPETYMQFLKVHSQFFSKKGELISPLFLMENMRNFQMENTNERLFFKENEIQAISLIPFYKYQENGFQCFLTEWTQNGEIGNIFFEEKDGHRLISTQNVHRTFLGWLQSVLMD